MTVPPDSNLSSDAGSISRITLLLYFPHSLIGTGNFLAVSINKSLHQEV